MRELFFYLETNALIILGNNLRKINTKENCYTSNLALLELIKNINESNFRLRQSLLRIIFDSKLRIDWEFSIAKIYSSFQENIPIFSKFEFMRDIFKIIIDASSFTDYQTKLRLSSLDNAMNSIQKYIEIPEMSRKEQINPMVHVMKELFNDKRGYSPDDISQFDLISMGTMLSSMIVARNSNTSPEMILSRYNGRIDIYHTIHTFILLSTFADYIERKKNDLTDVEHLLYLQNKITAIVSNDKFLIESVKRFYPRSAIAVDEFKSKFISIST